MERLNAELTIWQGSISCSKTYSFHCKLCDLFETYLTAVCVQLITTHKVTINLMINRAQSRQLYSIWAPWIWAHKLKMRYKKLSLKLLSLKLVLVNWRLLLTCLTNNWHTTIFSEYGISCKIWYLKFSLRIPPWGPY